MWDDDGINHFGFGSCKVRQFIVAWIVLSLIATVVSGIVYVSKYGYEGLSATARISMDRDFLINAQGGAGGQGGTGINGGQGGAGGAGGNVTIIVSPPVTKESWAVILSVASTFFGGFMAIIYFLLTPRQRDGT